MISRVLPVQIFESFTGFDQLLRIVRSRRSCRTTRTDGAPAAAARVIIIYYTHQSFQIDDGAPVDTQTNARPNLYKNVELRVLRPQIICSRVASHHCGRSIVDFSDRFLMSF